MLEIGGLFGIVTYNGAHPVKIGRMIGKCCKEPRAVKPDASHELVVDRLLAGAHLVDRRAKKLAELVSGLGGEAHGHQLALDRILERVEPVAAVTLLADNGLERIEMLLHDGKDREAALLHVLELVHRHGGGAHVGLIVVVAEHVARIIRSNEAVDDVVNGQRALADFMRIADDRRHGDRAAGDGEHHVLQAVLDALGDFDFAFTGKKLHRAHLAHVDAHGVGRAAEFAVDGRERGFGLRIRILLAGNALVAHHGERILVGSGFKDLNMQIRKNRHDGLDRIVIDQAVGQVVVDFAVGDVAALAPHADEREELGTAVLGGVLLVGAVTVEKRLLVAGAARLALAAADLGVRLRLAGFIGLVLFGKIIRQIGNVLLVVDVVVKHSVEVARSIVVVFGQIVLIRASLRLL